MTSQEIIDFCGNVAFKTAKRYPVIPSHYFLCTDGKFRSVRGIPAGVTISEPEQKKTYYVYWDSYSNTSFSQKNYLSEKEALDDQESRILKNTEEFKKALKEYDETVLIFHYQYWEGISKKST